MTDLSRELKYSLVYLIVTSKLQQTKKFIKVGNMVLLSPLFPQERAIRHLIERFIASPRVIIYYINYNLIRRYWPKSQNRSL